MIKLYAMVIVIGILGAIGYGAKYYYDTTQNKIAMLQKNNAQLEIAVQTANDSVNTLQADMARLGDLNKTLQSDLKKAEEYGDNLRNKLRELDLLKDALTDAEDLEGRMNGATAKIWRDIMEDTGGSGDKPLPSWLQSSDAGAGDQGSDQDRKDNNTDSSEAEASKSD